jgi:hypothetical protein
LAANLELVIRGIDKASGVFKTVDNHANSLAKTSGTVLKAGLLGAGAALGVATVAGIKFVGEAANLNEAINKSAVVFGAAGKTIEDFAATSAKSFGVAKVDAFAYAGTLGTILKGSGLTQEASADMSTQLVKLAADMASFNNIPIDQALEKIRAGLVGESEPLRTVGVLLSEAAVQQEAYASGIANVGDKLTDQQKVQARYAIILKQTADTQGDFARTSQSLTNQQRILGAEWKNIQGILGNALLPIVTALAQKLTAFLTEHEDDIQRFSMAFSVWAQQTLPAVARAFEDIGAAVTPVLAELAPIAEWFVTNKTAMTVAAIAIGAAITAMFAAWAVLVTAAAVATIAAAAPVLALVAAVALLAAGIFLLIKHWDEVTAFAEEHRTELTALGIAIGILLGPIGLLIGTIILVITHWDRVTYAVNNGVIPAFNGAVWAVNNLLIPAITGIGWAINNVALPALNGIAAVVNSVVIPALSLVATVIGSTVIPYIGFLVDAYGRVINIAYSLRGIIVQPFEDARDAVNWLIRRIEALIDKINSIPTPSLPSLPGVPDLNPFRALGGPVRAGMSYIVGEKGPEWFVPQAAGTIVPNASVAGGSSTYVFQAGAFVFQPQFSSASMADAERFVEWVTDSVRKGLTHG